MLDCIVKQIRLRRLYDINRVCYKVKSYDDTWLEECCNAVLSADVLDTNALVSNITAYRTQRGGEPQIILLLK